jgi:Tol biopolymer transport system component
MNAVWSPDGEQIAFTSDQYRGIWVADKQGENIQKITDDLSAGFGFSWSPSAKYILSRPAEFENRRRYNMVKLYDAKTGNEEVLLDKTRDLHALPIFTPDGSKVAMVLDQQLAFKESDWLKAYPTKRASEVIYTYNGRLLNISLITNKNAEVTAFEGRNIFNVRVSPNGEKVVFQVKGKGLYVINSDGTGLSHLGYGERASWMPDGKYVVVTLVEDDGQRFTGGELFAVNVNTAESYPLSDHFNMIALKPNVSPDGTQLLFENPSNGKIYIMPLNP